MSTTRVDSGTTKLEIISARKMKGGNFNLLPYLSEIVIYENIFRPALTGSLILKEAHNLPYKLPIVGEETINIDIGIRDFEDNKVRINPPPFHVNSIKDREIVKPKAQVLSLELISEKFMSDSHAKVSKSYRDKTISEIVTDIHNTYLDDGSDFSVEPTNRIERCVIPNMSPIDAINWLSKRTISESSSDLSKAVNYLFYETVSGSFFTSINSLIEKKPVFSCVLTPRVDDVYSDLALSLGVLNYNKIKFLNTFNRYENTKHGVYASKLITHDITTKKITQYEYNGFNNWFASNHLGMYPPLSNSDIETKSAGVLRTTYAPNEEANNFPTIDEKSLSRMIDSRVVFYPKHDRMYSENSTDLYDNKVEEWKLQRFANIGHFQGHKIYIETAGVSSLRVGQILNLDVPSTETTDGDDKSDVGSDKSLSGKFMITAIKHIFSAMSTGGTHIDYKMGIELSKDGLEEVVPYRESRKED
jgi:hypothetical protein